MDVKIFIAAPRKASTEVTDTVAYNERKDVAVDDEEWNRRQAGSAAAAVAAAVLLPAV